jgi:hypothetical protein
VQSIITEKYPETIYCPIETNGDGAVNVYSRVQMMLFKARLAAREEYKKTLAELGITVDELKAYLSAHPWRGSALYYPKHGTVASMAANVAQHVAADVKAMRVGKLLNFGKKMVSKVMPSRDAQHAAAAH